MRDRAPAILLFDGVCKLCNASVQFVLERDPGGQILFCAFQSPRGEALARRFGLDPGELRTIALIEGDRLWFKSSAALRIARKLRFPWTLLGAFWIVPRPLRDVAYDWVARSRYQWFGKIDRCLIPTDEVRRRFLE
jgi:predicted DCC family thiol-disulfide oxidoreductase YuxK